MIKKRCLRFSRLVMAGSAMLFVLGVLLLLPALHNFMNTRASNAEPQSDDCKCADLPALINRRREVTAAISAINGQISKLDADEKNANKVFGYTDHDYTRYFSDPIEQAVSATHDRNSQQVAEPGNFNADCRTSVIAAIGTCLDEGVADNREIRNRFCNVRIGPYAGDWRSQLPLETLADVARKGYLAERSYLDKQIERLLSTCKFGRWSGQVIVTYTKETTSKPEPKPVGTPGPHQNSRTEVLNTTESENVVITLVDGIAVAEGTADYSKHFQVSEGPELWCRASTRAEKAWVPFSHTENETYQVSGSVFRGANVSVSFNQDGTYTISVAMPSGTGSGTSSKDTSETGECGHAFPKTSNSVTYTVGGFHAKGKGPGKSSDLTLDGSDNPKPDVEPPNTMTGITMTWHLKRSPPK